MRDTIQEVGQVEAFQVSPPGPNNDQLLRNLLAENMKLNSEINRQHFGFAFSSAAAFIGFLIALTLGYALILQF